MYALESKAPYLRPHACRIQETGIKGYGVLFEFYQHQAQAALMRTCAGKMMVSLSYFNKLMC